MSKTIQVLKKEVKQISNVLPDHRDNNGIVWRTPDGSSNFEGKQYYTEAALSEAILRKGCSKIIELRWAEETDPVMKEDMSRRRPKASEYKAFKPVEEPKPETLQIEEPKQTRCYWGSTKRTR